MEGRTAQCKMHTALDRHPDPSPCCLVAWFCLWGRISAAFAHRSILRVI